MPQKLFSAIWLFRWHLTFFNWTPISALLFHPAPLSPRLHFVLLVMSFARALFIFLPLNFLDFVCTDTYISSNLFLTATTESEWLCAAQALCQAYEHCMDVYFELKNAKTVLRNCNLALSLTEFSHSTILLSFLLFFTSKTAMAKNRTWTENDSIKNN